MRCLSHLDFLACLPSALACTRAPCTERKALPSLRYNALCVAYGQQVAYLVTPAVTSHVTATSHAPLLASLRAHTVLAWGQLLREKITGKH